MKTREEIEREYAAQREAVVKQYYAQIEAARAARDAALAELDDPMARLIAAAKKALSCPFLYPVMQDELRDAIDYAEQRRVQG